MYHIHIEDNDLDLLASILTTTAGGWVDLVHNDPQAPETPDGVVITSVANGLAVARFADSTSGEAYGAEFVIGLEFVQKVNTW